MIRHAKLARNRDESEEGGTEGHLCIRQRSKDEEHSPQSGIWRHPGKGENQRDQDGSRSTRSSHYELDRQWLVQGRNKLIPAIRFTASSDVRRITVKYDVSFLPPVDDGCELPSPMSLPKVLPAAEDTPIWLFVAVRDTGPGLGPKELAMLFKRFSRECSRIQ